jgi:hypothetical protein
MQHAAPVQKPQHRDEHGNHDGTKKEGEETDLPLMG